MLELKIISWNSKGLRCPDGKVDLYENGYKRFNFIQMPNGNWKNYIFRTHTIRFIRFYETYGWKEMENIFI